MIDEQDIGKIIARTDDRYVRKDDCNVQMDEVKGQVGGLDADVKIIKNTVMITNKVLWAIFVAVLGYFVVTVLDKIF